jgi:PAS domain-containing protein
VSAYTVATVLAAAATGSLAVWLYRSTTGSGADSDRHPDLVRPFLVLLVMVTVSAFGYGLVTADGPSELGFGLVTFVLASVPWTVFALRYAGRGYLVTRLRVALLSAAALVVAAVTTVPVVEGLSLEGLPRSVVVATSTLSLGVAGVVFVTGGLVLLSTYRHGSLSLASGAVVVLLIAEFLFAGQVTRPSAPVFSTAVLTVTYVAVAAIAILSVTRYDVLSVRPGTGTLGERLAVEKMDEAVFVVGRRGDIARANETATRLFGAGIEGEGFDDVLGCPVAALRERDAIERWTQGGRMRFDPRVSTLTGTGGRTLGHTVTLLDVTDREIREQRIQVLNRVLRHNLRNNIDVIRARVEAAADEGRGADAHFEAVLDAAEELEGLGSEARRIEKLVADPDTPEAAVDLKTAVEAAVEAAVDTRAGATVTVEVPPVTVRTNERVLAFALETVVENAVTHNDSPDPRVEVRGSVTETGVRVRVADDGPGIPRSERAVIEAGQEDPLAHATSLGLWGTKWAVETLGGELSFGDSDLGGAVVSIDLPRADGDEPAQGQ